MDFQSRASIRRLVNRVLDGERLNIDEVDQFQAALREKLKLAGEPLDADWTRVFDLLRAMSLLDESDPALPWNRGSLLEDLGRHTEAADADLDAFSRMKRKLERGDQLDDGEEWAEAALYQACRKLIIGGQPLSAAILSRRLKDREYSQDIQDMLKTQIAE